MRSTAGAAGRVGREVEPEEAVGVAALDVGEMGEGAAVVALDRLGADDRRHGLGVEALLELATAGGEDDEGDEAGEHETSWRSVNVRATSSYLIGSPWS